MTYKEVYDKLTRLCSLAAGAGDSALSDGDKEWIDRMKRQETGEGVRNCSCRNRYTDAALELRSYLRKRGALAPERKYELRHGDLIWVGGDPYSNANLTDEVAETFLREHPDALYRFSKHPDNKTLTSTNKRAETAQKQPKE